MTSSILALALADCRIDVRGPQGDLEPLRVLYEALLLTGDFSPPPPDALIECRPGILEWTVQGLKRSVACPTPDQLPARVGLLLAMTVSVCRPRFLHLHANTLRCASTGRLLTLVGASGVGKSTITRALIASDPNLELFAEDLTLIDPSDASGHRWIYSFSRAGSLRGGADPTGLTIERLDGSRVIAIPPHPAGHQTAPWSDALVILLRRPVEKIRPPERMGTSLAVTGWSDTLNEKAEALTGVRPTIEVRPPNVRVAWSSTIADEVVFAIGREALEQGFVLLSSGASAPVGAPASAPAMHQPSASEAATHLLEHLRWYPTTPWIAPGRRLLQAAAALNGQQVRVLTVGGSVESTLELVKNALERT